MQNVQQEWCPWQDIREEHSNLKKSIAVQIKFPKDHITLRDATEKTFCEMIKLRLNCLGRTCSTTYGVKQAPHSNRKSSLQRESRVVKEHHDLGLFCGLRAQTVCPYRGKSEFPGLSRYPIGWGEGGCLPAEAHYKLNDVAGQ